MPIFVLIEYCLKRVNLSFNSPINIYIYIKSLLYSRSLRDSKYAGLINIHQNDIISIAKKHENFDLEKQYSKLICKIVVCEQGQDCSKVCPSLNRTPRRVRKSITQQVGDSSK